MQGLVEECRGLVGSAGTGGECRGLVGSAGDWRGVQEIGGEEEEGTCVLL